MKVQSTSICQRIVPNRAQTASRVSDEDGVERLGKPPRTSPARVYSRFNVGGCLSDARSKFREEKKRSGCSAWEAGAAGTSVRCRSQKGTDKGGCGMRLLLPECGVRLPAVGSGSAGLGGDGRGMRPDIGASTDLTVGGVLSISHPFVQDVKRTESEVCIFEPLNHALHRWDGVVVVPRWLWG